MKKYEETGIKYNITPGNYFFILKWRISKFFLFFWMVEYLLFFFIFLGYGCGVCVCVCVGGGGWMTSGTKHPKEDNPDLYYWTEIMEQRKQTFTI